LKHAESIPSGSAQKVSPDGHGTQALARHTWPDGHARKHAPQWAATSERSTHNEPQRVPPPGQAPAVTHAPPEHSWPVAHARAHAPQLRGSRCWSTHAPLGHIVKPVMHAVAAPHTPAVHV
jgi:hypothetical protein